MCLQENKINYKEKQKLQCDKVYGTYEQKLGISASTNQGILDFMYGNTRNSYKS